METQLNDDMLHGADAIARFLGVKKRTVYHMVEGKYLPTFRIGTTVFARKSTLMNWIEQQERAGA